MNSFPSSSSLSPATEALERALLAQHVEPSPPVLVAQKRKSKKSKKPMINSNPLKRSRNNGLLDAFDTFNMKSLSNDTEQLAASVEFPVIEWPSFDDSDSESAVDDCPSPIVKRRCLGSLRSFEASLDLSSLSCTEE